VLKFGLCLDEMGFNSESESESESESDLDLAGLVMSC
jgi:hypothetical protein